MSHNAAFHVTRNEAGIGAVEWFTGAAADNSGKLKIHVLHTAHHETQAALKRAAILSAGLDAKIVLIVPQIVPFPLPLDNPPVPLDFACGEISRLAACINAELSGYLYLCRDRAETFLRVLNPHSLIVMGQGKRRIFSKTRRLAALLRRNGHEVILANTI